MVILKFYRGNTLVRTEICSNEIEADFISSSEKNNYSNIVLVYGDENNVI